MNQSIHLWQVSLQCLIGSIILKNIQFGPGGGVHGQVQTQMFFLTKIQVQSKCLPIKYIYSKLSNNIFFNTGITAQPKKKHLEFFTCVLNLNFLENIGIWGRICIGSELNLVVTCYHRVEASSRSEIQYVSNLTVYDGSVVVIFTIM